MVDIRNMPREEVARRRRRAYEGRAEVGRFAKISAAQQRVDAAQRMLSGMEQDDPRLGGMIVELEAAIQERHHWEHDWEQGRR